MLNNDDIKAPSAPIESIGCILNNRVYINALDLLVDQTRRYKYGAHSLEVIIEHSETKQGLIVDLLTPCDSFWFVLKVLHLHFPSMKWHYIDCRVRPENEDAIAA